VERSSRTHADDFMEVFCFHIFINFLVFVCAGFGISVDWIHCIGFGILCMGFGSSSFNRKCHAADNVSLWPASTAQRPKGVCLGRGISVDSE
jgi:hypothetical protein